MLAEHNAAVNTTPSNASRKTNAEDFADNFDELPFSIGIPSGLDRKMLQ